MADSPARFEIADNQGTTFQQDGVVGTTPISIPDPAQAPIGEFIIQCPEDQDVLAWPGGRPYRVHCSM